MTTRYVVNFERIGRTHPNVDEFFEAEDADDLAELIWRRANGSLGSKMFGVTVDLAEGRGSIESGRFGRFTVREA